MRDHFDKIGSYLRAPYLEQQQKSSKLNGSLINQVTLMKLKHLYLLLHNPALPQSFLLITSALLKHIFSLLAYTNCIVNTNNKFVIWCSEYMAVPHHREIHSSCYDVVGGGA